MNNDLIPVFKSFIENNVTLQDKSLFTYLLTAKQVNNNKGYLPSKKEESLAILDIDGKKTISRFVLWDKGWIDFEIIHIQKEEQVYFRNTKIETFSHFQDILMGCMTSLAILESTL